MAVVTWSQQEPTNPRLRSHLGFPAEPLDEDAEELAARIGDRFAVRA